MAAPRYDFPTKGLGVENEIPGSIQIIARDTKFGLTTTVKKPTSVTASNVGSEQATTKSDIRKTEAIINLPMPPNLLYAQGAGYNQESLGATQAFAASASNASSFQDLVFNKGSDLIGAVLTDVSALFRNPLQLARGMVANPFSFTMFGQMAHRTFNYSWLLVPRNEIESQEVKAICDTLSYYQLPGRSTESFLQFLDIPLHFTIKYLWAGRVNRYIEQPNRCVLSNITVTYGGASRAQRHLDGAPIEVGLDLTFMEVEPLIRNKFDGNHTLSGGDKLKVDQGKLSNLKYQNRIKDTIDTFGGGDV